MWLAVLEGYAEVDPSSAPVPIWLRPTKSSRISRWRIFTAFPVSFKIRFTAPVKHRSEHAAAEIVALTKISARPGVWSHPRTAMQSNTELWRREVLGASDGARLKTAIPECGLFKNCTRFFCGGGGSFLEPQKNQKNRKSSSARGVVHRKSRATTEKSESKRPFLHQGAVSGPMGTRRRANQWALAGR